MQMETIVDLNVVETDFWMSDGLSYTSLKIVFTGFNSHLRTIQDRKFVHNLINIKQILPYLPPKRSLLVSFVAVLN